MNLFDWIKALRAEKQALSIHRELLEQEIKKSQIISSSTVALVDLIAITVKEVKEEKSESRPNH